MSRNIIFFFPLFAKLFFMVLFWALPAAASDLFGFGFFREGPIYRAPEEVRLSIEESFRNSAATLLDPPSKELVSHLESHGIPFPGSKGYEDEVFLTWFEETGNGSGLGTIALKVDLKDYAIIGLVQRYKKESYYPEILESPLYSPSEVAHGVVLNRVPIAGNIVTMKAKRLGGTPVESLREGEMERWGTKRPVVLRFRTKADSISPSSWNEHEFIVTFIPSKDPNIRSAWRLSSGETGKPIRRIVLRSWRSVISGGISEVVFSARDFAPVGDGMKTTMNFN